MEKRDSFRGKTALIAALLAQLGKSPELTRLVILLLVMGHLRLRPHDLVSDDLRPRSTSPGRPRPIRRKGFTVKRPRERFL